jgi:hypothetical protein
VGEQPLNPARIEAVLGYALAVAAQADHPRDRELGPIHLLKYLYLADLAHAETHGGESYSGVDSKTRLKKMREEVQRRLAKKREARRTVVPQPPPRYDEVFAEGVAWLDGPEPEPRRGKLSFSDEVWTSRARGDTELTLGRAPCRTPVPLQR